MPEPKHILSTYVAACISQGLMSRENREKPTVGKRQRVVGRSPVGYAGKSPGRNQPCPCGSGKKFKKCCRNKS